MGRKTNPKIIRISNQTLVWDSHWFSDRQSQYRENLLQDLLIRRYLETKLRAAAISRVEIGRDQKEVVLTIHTSRPAMVIGRGGSGIELIQGDLKKILLGKLRLRINVQEIRNPDTNAMAVATQVVDQLERRMPYRRALKQSVQRAIQAGAVGVRVAVSGRLNGADIARREWLAEGSVPLATFRIDIDYARLTARTVYGAIGVKVWINRGEFSTKPEEEKPKQQSRAPQEAKRQRTSLAEKAAAQRRTPAKSSKK
ncbi:30S ribosomal protein S3 [Patescibacteria group bacterium]|nr:30S ribosomal protein S3 [Patescibacteria group bacterium]